MSSTISWDRSIVVVLCASLALAAREGRDELYAHKASVAHVVKAYQLPLNLASRYDRADRQPACFWQAWESGQALDKARIVGNSRTHSSGEVPEGEDDCVVVLKAAYSDSGVYLLFEVTDDAWIGIVDTSDRSNDALEIFTDRHSSSELYGDLSLFKSIDYSQLTETYMQVHCAFGGTGPITQCSYNFHNPAYLGHVRVMPNSFVAYNGGIPLADAWEKYGLMLKVFQPAEDTSAVRRQEWFISWRAWGGPHGDSMTKPQVGSRAAFTFGYNDKDRKDQTGATLIRWRNGADPYAIGVTSMGTNATIDAWGDIEFTDVLPDANSCRERPATNKRR